MMKIKMENDENYTESEYISAFDTVLYDLKCQLTGKQYDELTNKMMITILESKED